MDQERITYLEMIQAIVTRQAGNSFTVKGWSLILVSALFALAANDSNQNYVLLAIVPNLCFWGLDAYYLRQERLFRKLFDAARAENQELFSMDTSSLSGEVRCWLATLVARVVVSFYGAILAATALIWFVFRCTN